MKVELELDKVRNSLMTEDDFWQRLQEIHNENSIQEFVEAPMGWICPVCGQGMAPNVLSCPCASTSGEPSRIEVTY